MGPLMIARREDWPSRLAAALEQLVDLAAQKKVRGVSVPKLAEIATQGRAQ